jgi:hypothetical protein
VNRSLSLGIVVIAAGIIVMLGKLGVFQALISWLWPLLLLVAGGALYMTASNRRLPSIAFLPAVVLIVLSILFLLCAWFGWHLMKVLWPLIILSISGGMHRLAEYERSRTLRKLSLVVGATSLLLFFVTLLLQINTFIVALIFIAVGIIVIARKPRLR